MTKRKAREKPPTMPTKKLKTLAASSLAPPSPISGYDQLLTRDIRLVIYHYMEWPCSDKKDWHGLALSCKDAYDELTSEAVHLRTVKLNEIAKGVQQKSGIEIHFSALPDTLNWVIISSVTVTVPAKAMMTIFSNGFEQLLALKLDKLTFMFTGDAATAKTELRYDRTDHDGSYLTTTPVPSMPWLYHLRDILTRIASQYRYQFGNDDQSQWARTIHSKGIMVPCIAIMAKRFVLAWDFCSDRVRAQGMGRQKWLMQGKVVEYKLRESHAGGEGATDDPSAYPFRWEMMGKGGLLGEAGVFVGDGDYRGFMVNIEFLMCYRIRRRDIVSKGIGAQWTTLESARSQK
ncbi:hypothetical protein CC80DRAFT_494068 [Byssothecium circinans]|uniref:Uncharacterized protein n=1 Tax=Byssothecium circinans TaxID=147558 RepID=A0A6A5TU75_9PLEO|nr:hypothetical protein CC80DRAFT_494068 [Byssothecium circinans]